MNETILCPGCQRKLAVPENLLGQDVRCPSCGVKFTASIHTANAPPPPLPTPPPLPESRPDLGDDPDFSPRRARRRDYDEDDDEDDRFDRRDARRRDLLPHRASTVLTMGILSLVMCAPILGPIAWVMGNHDISDMREGRMDPEGEGTTNAGRICGMIATCVFFGSLVVSLLILLFFCGFGALLVAAKK